MIDVEYDSLIKHIRDLGFETNYDKDQLLVKIPAWDGHLRLYVKVYETGDLMQLVLVLPFLVKPERFDEVGRLMHLLNREMDLPGFCVDETSGAALYRLTLPIFDDVIHPQAMHTLLNSIQNVAKQCLPVIHQAADGKLDLDSFLNHSRSAV